MAVDRPDSAATICAERLWRRRGAGHRRNYRQQQARNLIRAIQLGAPGVGRPWNRDLRNRLHWIASAYDAHVIYRVSYRRQDDELLITGILVYETPPDPNNA